MSSAFGNAKRNPSHRLSTVGRVVQSLRARDFLILEKNTRPCMNIKNTRYTKCGKCSEIASEACGDHPLKVHESETFQHILEHDTYGRSMTEYGEYEVLKPKLCLNRRSTVLMHVHREAQPVPHFRAEEKACCIARALACLITLIDDRYVVKIEAISQIARIFSDDWRVLCLCLARPED